MHFRPFAGVDHSVAALALSMTGTRRVFKTPTDAVFYLGERVVRQYARDLPVVPADPPAMMMHSNLLWALGNSFEAVDHTSLLTEGVAYSEVLIPRLAPAVKFIPRPRVLALSLCSELVCLRMPFLISFSCFCSLT